MSTILYTVFMIVWCHIHAGHLKPKYKYCKDESRKSRANFFGVKFIHVFMNNQTISLYGIN